MQIRYKKTGRISFSSNFNINALTEVLVEDDSPSICDLDVFVTAENDWMDMAEAFKNGDLIVDNYNTYFFEPETEEERKLGYRL